MEINPWLIGSIIVILIIWVISVSGNEFFDDIKPRYHAKIDKNCNVVYYSPQSPRQNGDVGCALIPCPPPLGDNITCWSCCRYNQS